MDVCKKTENEEPADPNSSISERIQGLGTASDLIFPRSPMIFDCNLCSFGACIPEEFKNHLKTKHGKKRPRIYFCINCPKSYGILQSYRVHLETVHGRTVEEAKALAYALREAKVARLKAEEIDMQAETEAVPIIKCLDNATINPDYTFDVHASTLKAANITIKYVCDFCDSELTTIHQMQEHMKTAHGTCIGISPCLTCDTYLINNEHCEPHLNLCNKGAEKTSKLKSLLEGHEDISEQNPAQGEDVYLIYDLKEESSLSTSKYEKNMKVQPHKKARLELGTKSIDGISTAAEFPPIPQGHDTKLKCPGCKTSFFTVRDYVKHCAVCEANGRWYPCGVGNCGGLFITAKYLNRHLTIDHKRA